MPGSSSWMPYAPQGIKGLDGGDKERAAYSSEHNFSLVSVFALTFSGISLQETRFAALQMSDKTYQLCSVSTVPSLYDRKPGHIGYTRIISSCLRCYLYSGSVDPDPDPDPAPAPAPAAKQVFFSGLSFCD